jgi:hypothetical protein
MCRGPAWILRLPLETAIVKRRTRYQTCAAFVIPKASAYASLSPGAHSVSESLRISLLRSKGMGDMGKRPPREGRICEQYSLRLLLYTCPRSESHRVGHCATRVNMHATVLQLQVTSTDIYSDGCDGGSFLFCCHIKGERF